MLRPRSKHPARKSRYSSPARQRLFRRATAPQPFELSSTKIEMPTMTPQNSNLARELFLLLVLATLWGSSYSFIKIGVETIPPITLIAARTLIAGGILLAVL